MSLLPGTRLGPYEIGPPLGAGGMGEVYRARDTKLNRDVAVKVLPEAYASDADRLSRFTREAQAVAALNHSGIAGIHELGEVEGQRFLVLELIDGDTLADRLKRGAIAVDDALQIAKQILEALEAAHEKGIAHRDLKPANIKLTPGGVVKILDFGLAKFMQSAPAAGNLTHSPTLSLAGTYPGVILGTAGYMSPEQAKGYDADQRSDIFSFGCILFEMLTGRQAFEAETASEILAAVLMREVDLSKLPPRLNPRLVELLKRCLEKNPKNRWHAAADVRVEIDSVIGRAQIVDEPRAAVPLAPPLWKRALALGAAAVFGALAAGYAVWTIRPEAARPVMRFTVALPEDQRFSGGARQIVALSPDGTRLVYAANGRFYLRPLSALTAQPIAGSEGVSVSLNPVFSPDGQWLVFGSGDGGLKRLAVGGGAPVTLCPAGTPYGISWHRDDIVFGQAAGAPSGAGILRVSSNGGVPQMLVAAQQGELLDTPQLLDDGRAILFTARKATATGWDGADIVAQRLDGGERKVLISGGADARYLETGHLMFARGGVLLAVPFDEATLSVHGGPVPVVEGVRRAIATSAAFAAVSASGVLAFVKGPLISADVDQMELGIFDRSGRPERFKLPPGPYRAPRVSPDGRRVVFENVGPRQTFIQVFTLNAGAAAQRLTFDGNSYAPVWSADGQWIYFYSDREADNAIFRQRADGSGQAERLTKPEKGTIHIPQSASPDGQLLAYAVQRGDTAGPETTTLWTLSLKDRQSTELKGIAAREAAFSPDGRWIAYHSRVDGVGTVFVEPFPRTGAKYQVPRAGGHPVWIGKGRALLLNTGPAQSHLVTVTTTPAFAFGPPAEYPRTGRVDPNPTVGRRNTDTMPEGEHVVGVISGAGEVTGTEITIVLNWFEELKQRVPVDGTKN